jgi:methyl-accepting chemotaxis protein
MEQIAAAMENISQASRHNTTLANETRDAATHVAELATRLDDLVAHYKL